MASVKTHNPAPSPILVVNPVFQNWCQDDAKKNQRALVASRVENRHLDNWSLSDEQPNTSSAAHFKSASMFSSNRVVACFLVVVCLVSISALVLTIMMLFGKIGDRCGCSNTQGMIQFQNMYSCVYCNHVVFFLHAIYEIQLNISCNPAILVFL